MSPTEYLLVFLAAIGAGIVNAIAGGGTLISFPALMVVGIPPVVANITSTVSLCPGYLGATYAQKKELKGQAKKLWIFLHAGAAGGIIGGILLLNTGEKVFRGLVPFLILIASFLLAIQDPIRKWLNNSLVNKKHKSGIILSVVLIIPAAIYGGYFGAGLSVIVLSALGITLNENLTKLNAFKQFIAFSVNISAAIFFLFSGLVVWTAAIIMAAGALMGGYIGGRIAGFIKPSLLRIIVVAAGIIISIIYFFQ